MDHCIFYVAKAFSASIYKDSEIDYATIYVHMTFRHIVHQNDLYRTYEGFLNGYDKIQRSVAKLESIASLELQRGWKSC